jgi:hypothetical protein
VLAVLGTTALVSLKEVYLASCKPDDMLGVKAKAMTTMKKSAIA